MVSVRGDFATALLLSTCAGSAIGPAGWPIPGSGVVASAVVVDFVAAGITGLVLATWPRFEAPEDPPEEADAGLAA